MVTHPKRSKRTDWDVRGTYVAVYDPATNFFREWSMYATQGGATALPEVRQQMAKQSLPPGPTLEIAGVRQQDRVVATQILQTIARLADDPMAQHYIATKLLMALMAVCKYRPHFLLRRQGKGIAIGHIDVVDEPGEARDALMARYAEIRKIAPKTFKFGADGSFPVAPPSTEKPRTRKPIENPIADIYVRAATPSASSGLERQEQACRAWCREEGIEVRNVIKEIGRPFSGRNESDGRAFTHAFDGWRKAYWEAKGEPLDARECDPSVVPVPPPNLLVMEGIDRLSTDGVTKGTITLMLLGAIGIQVKPINLKSSMTTTGSATYHDDNGTSVRVDPDGTTILGLSDSAILGGKPKR